MIFINYYNEIKNKLIDEEIYQSVKDYSKEQHKVKTYFETGELLFNAGKHYGENIIGKYAKKLEIEVNKKYNERTLRRIRQLYVTFKNENWSTLSTKLSWSHYSELLVLLVLLLLKRKINMLLAILVMIEFMKQLILQKKKISFRNLLKITTSWSSWKWYNISYVFYSC